MNKLLSILLFIVSFDTQAVVLEHEKLRLHINGYAGYKYITNTTKNTAISSNPELGLELALDINDNWSAFTQLVYEDTVYNSVAYSFITYHAQSEDELEFKVNAGKLRHDYGLYNSSRINPITRQGVIIPQAIYWDSLKHILTSGEGVNTIIKWKNLELGYTIDNPIVTHPTEEALTWTNGLLDHIDTYFGSHQLANIKYTFDDVPLVLKSSWSKLDLGGSNTAVTKFVFPTHGNKHQTVEIFNAGGILTLDKWTLSSEILIVKSFYNQWFANNHSTGTSYTIQRELTENISATINYNQFISSFSKKNYAIPWNFYSKDLNLGLNYHEDHWMVGLDVHHLNGGRWVDPIEFSQNPTSYKDWWMVGMNVVYFF